MPIYESNGKKYNIPDDRVNDFIKSRSDAKLIDSTPYYISRAKSTGRQSNISKQTDTQVEETPVQQHNNGIAGGYTTFQDGTSGFIPAMKMPDIKIEQPKLGFPKSQITKGTPFESKSFTESAQETMRNMPIGPEAQFDITQSTYKQNQDWIKEVQNDPTISPEVKQALLDDYKKNIRISDNTIEDKDLPLYAKKWLEENKVSVPATVHVPGSPMFGGGQYVEGTKQVNTPEQIAFIKDFIANTPQGQDLVNRQKAYVEYLENSISDVETRVQELKKKYWQDRHDLTRSHPYAMGMAYGKAVTDAAREDYLEKYNALTKRMSALKLAEKNAEEQKKLLAAVRDGDLNVLSQFGKQIGRDFGEMAGDIGTLGIRPLMQSLNRYYNVKGLQERIESGEPLSEEDRLAMSALANNQAYKELMGDRRTIAQEVASGITQSVPFMVNFATTGGIGKAVTGGAKELLKQGIKRNVVNAIKQGAKIGTEKIGARLAGFGLNVADAVGRSSIMAAISPHTYKDMFDNMTGQVTYGYDEEGKPYYLGNIEQMDVANALLNAWGSKTIENVSEFSGFGLEKGQAALSQLLKQRVPEVAKALSFGSTRNQFFQGVNQAMEKAGFNGTINEFLEEQIATILHSFFEDGQAQWSDLVDPRQQFITYLTVAAIGSGSAIMNTGGNQLMKYGAKKAYNNALKDFDTELYNGQNNDIGGQYKHAIQNGTIEEKQNALANIVNNTLLNDKQKLAALNLYRASLTYEAYEGTKTAQVEEATQEIPALIEENVNPEMGAVVSATIAGVDKSVQITDGKIVQNDDGTINREQSDKQIFYVDAEGNKQVTSIEFVENIDENIPTQDAIAQLTEAETANLISQQENEEVRPYQAGETVRFSPGGNTSLIGQIVGQNEDGSYVLQEATTGQQISVQPRQIINEDNLLGVENGSPVIYTNQKGEQVQDVVATTPDLYAQGLIGFENGDVVKIENVIGLAENSNWPQKDKETFIPDNFDIENQKNTEEFQLATKGQNTIPFIEQIPQNESGSLLFEQAPVETTLGALNEVYSDAAELSGVVDATISNIQKQIDKAKSPKPTGDINKDIANKQKANKQIEELNNRLSYWEGVRNAIQQSQPIEQRVTEQLTGKEPQTINLDKEKKPKTVNRNTPFKRRLNAVEENIHSIRDRILYGIASGTYKFRWKDQGVSMGLARELGLSGSVAERKARINLLSNNGYTPSTLAHHIWEETGMNLNDNDIRSEIIDVLNSVYSRKQALETLENSAGITEEKYQQQESEASDYKLELRAQEEALISEAKDQINEKDLLSLRNEAIEFGATEKQLNEIFTSSDYIDLIEQLKDGQESDTGRNNEQTETVESEGNKTESTQRAVGERNRSAEDTGDQRPNTDSTGDRITLSPEELRVVNEATAQIDAGIAEARKELTTQQKELSSARKRLGKAQADTQGNLFGSEQQSKLFDVPADLSKENAVDNILSPIQQQIDAAQTNLDTLTNSRDARIQEALDNYRKQGKVFEEVTPRNLATEKGYNPAHFKKGDFVIDKYRRDIYEIIEPDKRGMAVLENIKTKWRQDYNAHNNAHFILYEQTIEDKIAQAEAETDTNPTEAQKEAGNYKKGKVTIQGFDISIEQPKGSVRSGVDENGKPWSVTMNNTYGYIRKTEGKDGDHIDVFLGENPESNRVFVVDQVNRDGSFDEHKVMLGFDTIDEAREAYLSNYEEGWQGLGNITQVDIETFRKWTESNTRRIKPFAEYKHIQDRADSFRVNVVPNTDSAYDKQARAFIDKYVKTIKPKQIKKFAKDGSYEVFALFDKQYPSESNMTLHASVQDTYKSALGRDIENMNIVRAKYNKETNTLNLDYYNGSLFGDYIGELYADNGYLKEEVKDSARKEIEEHFGIKENTIESSNDVRIRIVEYSDKSIAVYGNTKEIKDQLKAIGGRFNPKLKDGAGWIFPKSKESDVRTLIEGQSTTPVTSEVEVSTPAYGASNTIISTAKYEELRKQMRDKLNNLNSGFDPELFTIGTQMAMYHIEAGARKFADFSSRMIEDLGEKIKPYLKSFYEGARHAPGMDELSKDMDSSEFVSNFDIDNFNSEDYAKRESSNIQPDSQELLDREQVDQGTIRSESAEGGQDANGFMADDVRKVVSDNQVPRENGSIDNSGRSNPLFSEEDYQGVSDGQSELPTTDSGDTRGSDTDVVGRQDDGQRESAAVDSESQRSDEGIDLVERQRSIKSADVVLSDINNIRETLPVLKPEQQQDVQKAEKRYFTGAGQKNEVGAGMLFTNGTGTGKTFTGVGIIKRFLLRGIDDIIIVVPNQKIASDWIATADTFFDEQFQLLNDTKDQGRGVVVTTYANYRQNEALNNRQWALIVYDECHYLNQNASGNPTAAQKQDGILGINISEAKALAEERIGNERPVAPIRPEEMFTKETRYNYYGKKEYTPEYIQYEKDYEKYSKDKEQFDERFLNLAKEIHENRPKKLYLSATPFAYHKSLSYADGSLFVINETFDSSEGYQGYNVPDRWESFMVENFGYRMRYNKLTVPENAAAVSRLEQLFHEKLVSSGAVSGRSIDVPYDYSRDFVVVQSGVGTKIDEGIHAIWNDKRINILNNVLNKKWNYIKRAQFLEAAKSQGVKEHVDNLLANGYKVVIFHDFIKGNTQNPLHFEKIDDIHSVSLSVLELARLDSLRRKFDSESAEMTDEEILELQNLEDIVSNNELESILSNREKIEAYNKAVDIWNSEYSQYANLDFSDIEKPLTFFSREYEGRIGLFNGIETKRKRLRVADEFNKDDSGIDIILVQRQAGKEGISFHDTTGNKPRVLINLGLPTAPTDAIQIEGRTYRIGLQSNTAFQYPILNTSYEAMAFADKIASRSKTAENLALGTRARKLENAFKNGYQNPIYVEDIDYEAIGEGSKKIDKFDEVEVSPYRDSVALFSTVLKNTKRRENREGKDYFATPEPVGFKMVEWLQSKDNDSVLEPSAGHGAIARFFNPNITATAVEPSYELATRLRLNTTAEVKQHTFEDLHIVNKYDGIVMNPPFGVGGKTAIEHVEKAFKHLRTNGRMIAIIPNGGATEKRFNAFMESKYAKDAYLRATYVLPGVAFKNAGTNISTKVVIIDKVADPKQITDYAPTYDYSRIDNIDELFDRLEFLEAPERIYDTEGNNPPPTRRVGYYDIVEPSYESETESIQEEVEEGIIASIEDYTHTKTGEILAIARVEKKLGHNDFVLMARRAKEFGGTWSRFAKGFLFENRENANKFRNAENTRESTRMQASENTLSSIPREKLEQLIDTLKQTGLAVDVVMDENIRSNPELRDAEGNVYGYVNPKGIIHLDATRMNANTPIHEFGHLWNDYIKKNNTELYQKGVELIKQSPYYWEHVYNNPAYSNLSEDRKIDEALAMAIGDKGEGFVNRNMRQRFVDWLSEVWKAIKKAFGINIDIAIEDMTLSDFTDLATKQLLGGEKLTDTENYNTFGTNETRKQQNEISLGSSEEKLRGSDEASSREQEASIYLRRRIEAAREEQQRPLTEREIIDVEKRAALDYAKENNLWINDIYDLGIPFPGGGNENTLAYDVDKRIIYKSNNLLNTKGSISRLLNQIQINNELFPETKYNLIGFTGIDNGNKNTPFIEVVMSQNYIPNAIQATPEDIEVYMRAKGFDKINDSSFTNGVYTVSDLYPRNVLKDNDNNIYVVDNIIEENSSKDIIRFQSVNDVADAVGSNMTEDVKKKLNDELNKTAHKIAEAWFDRWLPVKKMLQTLEKSGLKIEDHNNWYLRADAVTSSIQSQYEGIFYNCYMLPFLKSISAIESKGYTLRDIENYALLKGGLERNEIKRSEAINKYKTEHPDATKEQIEAFEKQLPSDYAGVTAIEEEIGISADEYISDFENNVGNNHIADFWKKKNAATNYTLKRIYDSGGISKSEYDKLLKVKYYVPFRGHDKQTAEDLYDYSPNMGVYFSNPMIKANGRRTRAENPFAYIDQMGLSAIKFANWNSLNQSLYRLASKDKTNILTCDKAWYVQTGINEDNTPIWESQEPAYSDNSEQYRKNQDDFEKRMLELQKEGLAIQQRGRFDLDGLFIKPAQREQHRMPVWVNGNEYSIYINANPAIAQSINGTNLKQRVIDEQYKEVILKAAYLLNEGLGKTQRWMANNITSKSPEFMMRNLMRDVIQSATILPVKEGMKYEKDFLSNLPKSAAALTRYFAGKSNISNPTDAALVNFFLSGGATGYVHFLELQKNQKKINKEISDLKKSNFVKTYGFLKYIPDSIEAANKWAENLSRFAVYLTSMQQGRSIARSISDAKEVTVNFNRTGSGKMGNSLLRNNYMFVNPALQAIYNMSGVASKNRKKFTALTIAFGSLGFIAPMLSLMIGGDDGWDEYWNLSEWDRQNNFCIYTGNGFVKISLPQEFRIFTRMGDNLFSAILDKKDKLEASIDSVLGFADLSPINPLGLSTDDLKNLSEGGILAKATPDRYAPFVELAVNKNFADNRIYNQYANKYRPGHKQSLINKKGEYKSPDWLVDFSKTLNDITGGDDVTCGLISLNPDKLNHLLRAYLGGIYITAAQAADITNRVLDPDKNIEIRNTPLRALYISNDDIQSHDNPKYFDILKDVDKKMYEIRGYQKEVQQGKLGVYDFAKKLNSLNYAKLLQMDKLIKEIKKYESALKNLDGQDQKDLEKIINELKKEVIEVNNKLSE